MLWAWLQINLYPPTSWRVCSYAQGLSHAPAAGWWSENRKHTKYRTENIQSTVLLYIWIQSTPAHRRRNFLFPFQSKDMKLLSTKKWKHKANISIFPSFLKRAGEKKNNKQCKTHYFSCITNTLYQVNKTFLPFLLPVAPTAPYHALFVPHRQFLLKEFPPSASLFQSSQSEQR